MPTPDQRTNTIRLKYESDATRNYNWEKLDETLGAAFTPESPLQIPPDSITSDQLAPGAAVANYFSSAITGDFWALATPRILATFLLSPYRGGHIMTGGMLCLKLTNRKVAPAPVAMDFRLTLTIGTIPYIIGSWSGLSLPPTTTIPLGVPLSGVFGVPAYDITSSIPIRLEGMKLAGTDADTVITDSGGVLYATELA